MMVIPIVFETVGAGNRRASWGLTVQSMLLQYSVYCISEKLKVAGTGPCF